MRIAAPLATFLVAQSLSATIAAGPAAAVPTTTAQLIQRINTAQWAKASPDPSGVTYAPSLGHLLVTDSEVDETTGAGQSNTNLWETTLTGSVQRSGNTYAYTKESTGLGYDPATRTLFVSTDTRNRNAIDLVRPGSDDAYGTADDTQSSFSTAQYGATDTEDPAFDTSTGDLFWVDGAGREVYRLDPVDDRIGNSDDVVRHFSVRGFISGNVEGLAYNPGGDTLFAGDNQTLKIYEITKTGSVVSIIDASHISGLQHLSGLGVGPSSDDASKRSIWIVDRGVDNGSNPRENDGEMFEIRVPGGGGTTNTAPSVSAGPDQSITLPASANLQGSVTDDGLPNPPGTTSKLWTRESGPGVVTFGDATSPTTTASFSAPGTYVLLLTASDGALSEDDAVTIRVFGAGGGGVLDVPVSRGSDDAEEAPDGTVTLTAQNLKLVNKSGIPQTVGLRFASIAIPSGATVTDAYVQFTAESTGSTAVSLSIRGEAADDPVTFSTRTDDITSRSRTTASVSWSPPAWSTVGAAGEAQRTSDLSPVLNQLVGRSGWASGNAVVLIITGSGRRVAESFEGGAPPILHVEFQAV